MTWEPLSHSERSSDRLKHAFNMFDIISKGNDYQSIRDPSFDYLKKAEQYRFQTEKINAQGFKQPKQPKQSSQFNQSAMQGGGSLAMFINAIAGQESGGNYGAVNSSSGALGKYQIMPANIPSWSQAALGRQISSQAFLNHPKLQEQIAQSKLREYFRKYGAAGAASAWYSGSADNWNSRTSQGAYPSVSNYVLSILKAMGIR